MAKDLSLEPPVGPKGDTGATGSTGATGPAGPGVPTGGTTNQVLAKTSNTNYATGWVNQSGGSPDAVIVGTSFDKVTGNYHIQGHVSPDNTYFNNANTVSHGQAAINVDATGDTFGEITLSVHDDSGDNVFRIGSPLDSPAGLQYNGEVFPNWPFTPATPSDWQGPPATVRDALDELAARVKALEP